MIEMLERTGWRVSGERGAAKLLGLKPTTLGTDAEARHLPPCAAIAGGFPLACRELIPPASTLWHPPQRPQSPGAVPRTGQFTKPWAWARWHACPAVSPRPASCLPLPQVGRRRAGRLRRARGVHCLGMDQGSGPGGRSPAPRPPRSHGGCERADCPTRGPPIGGAACAKQQPLR